LSLPAATIDGNCLGVIDWGGYSANNFTSSLLLYGNHDSVVNYLLMLFANRLHDCVVDNSLASLIHGLTDGVVDYLFVCFTNRHAYCVIDHFLVCLMHRLHDCVIDNLLMCFTHRNAYGVLNFFGVSFIHWTTYVVRNLLNFGVINRLVDGVFTSPSLINWLTNCLIDSSHTCLALHTSNIDYLVFGNRLILSACALNSLFFVNRTSYSFHYCVGRWHSCFCSCTRSTSAAILVAYRSTVVGVGSTG
jgi:hypothetical protein